MKTGKNRDESPDQQGFAALDLDNDLTTTLSALGYEEHTPVQREAIPALLTGRDPLGQAATGTGKTAAFALPMLQRVAALSSEDSQAPSALVLVPTRELAMQVAEAVHRYLKSLQVHVLPINGGQAMQLQLRAFSMKPMRCWTWGFAEDLEAILTTLPPQRQTALFSATIAPRIASIAK